MAEQPRRKLAVIVHADVVGSTALVRLDETLAHERIRDAFRRLSERVAAYGGVTHELRGDALVAEFGRASDALCAAIAFQAENKALNATQDASVHAALRIGISMGEVVVADNTVIGEGVVLAQRLEQIAGTDGVCIQGAVYETVPKRLPFRYESRGEQQLKGFEAPVRAYDVALQAGQSVPAPESPAGSEKTTPLASSKPSIAVLPFTNMSGDPEQEYFSDGLTEDIITALSSCHAFPVIARNSTFTYKGRAVRVQEVASELGARYVLEGSVRAAASRVRITVQLIEGESGHHVWAAKFDRALEDVFAIQDEITQRVAACVEPELQQVELQKSAVRRPESLTAWDYFLRAMAHLHKHTLEGNAECRKLFRQAIELEPGYGEAWAGLAWSYVDDIFKKERAERTALIEKGLDAARKAVEVDDSSAIAHYVLGMVYTWQEQFQLGIAEVRRALALNPFLAQAQMGLGNRLDLIGETREGIEQMERSLELNPRDPTRPNYMAFLARAHGSIGQHREALKWIEEANVLRSADADLRYRLAIALANLDRVDEARKALAECERLQPGFLHDHAGWQPYADTERNETLLTGLKRHELVPPAGT